ncbi:MAG: nitroreductase family protein [Lachnospiraceae bacterium]|nr:nitroreductase family protein [Lachnospiraceae bacterium]
MNEVIKQLLERKSVRAFTEKEVDEEIVQEILTAAVMAPSAGNMQMYTILRISDPEILTELSELCDHQPFIAKGKLVLLFLADYRKWQDAFRYAGCGERAPGEGDLILAIDDAVIAAQNAVTAAWSYGIGSCYIGDVMENIEQLRELLHLPELVFPAALLVFGYPTEQQQKREKPERTLAHMVHENTYRILTEEELKEQLGSKTGGKEYEEWIRAFCKRKFDSDFSIEMTRSVQEYLKQWR